MIPFSEDELEYIARLDAEADMDLLRRELPSLREESLRTLQVATILLQRCAAAGTRCWPSSHTLLLVAYSFISAASGDGSGSPPVTATSAGGTGGRLEHCTRLYGLRVSTVQGSPWQRLAPWRRGPLWAWRRSPPSWSASAWK